MWLNVTISGVIVLFVYQTYPVNETVLTIIEMPLQISLQMYELCVSLSMCVLLLALLCTVYGQEPTNRPSNGEQLIVH